MTNLMIRVSELASVAKDDNAAADFAIWTSRASPV